LDFLNSIEKAARTSKNKAKIICYNVEAKTLGLNAMLTAQIQDPNYRNKFEIIIPVLVHLQTHLQIADFTIE
jgi:hypothetical protein